MKIGKLGFTLSLVLAQGIVSGIGAYTYAAEKVLNFAMQFEPPQLNSTKATDTQSGFVIGHVMEGLTRVDKNSKVKPGMAEKWEINDKGATFYLRKNAKWSDGKPVTAKDFVFSWRMVVDPKTASEYAFIMYPIKNAEAINKGKMAPTELGVAAVDDHTLKVTFEKPCGYFLGLTAFGTFMPIREDFYNLKKDRYAANAEDMLYNGPFMITKWVHGASMRLDKNPNYWNAAAVQLDAINVPYITADNSAQFNFFKDKKTDLVERLGKEDLAKASGEGFKQRVFKEGGLFYLEFNHRPNRVTRNANLRKAIAAIFNPKEYVQVVVGIPGTRPGNALIPEWVGGVKDTFRKEFPLPERKQDLAAAKKYLEAAKKELGLSTIPPLAWLCDDKPIAAREAEYFQRQLKTHLGIDIKIDKQIFKQRLAKMTAGEFDIVSAGWSPDYNDPLTFADLWASWNDNNRGKYNNPKYDELIRKAQSTSDNKIRMAAMAEAEKIALEELAVLPVYERTVLYLQHDRVDGVLRHTVGFDPDFTQAKVVKQ